MAKYFDFYDPLERRYVFNSFLVVAALVEILILVFTLIWQIDFRGIFTDRPDSTPFPWRQYLLASFAAPIVLLFLFGLIVKGFDFLYQEASPPPPGAPPEKLRLRRWAFPLGVLTLLFLLILCFWGGTVLPLLADGVKALGLGGVYLLIALLALGMIYLPLRLLLRYRLQKKSMEYQYLLSLAARYGVMVVDPKLQPELARLIAEKKISPLPAPEESVED
jgi:hypothetical protein